MSDNESGNDDDLEEPIMLFILVDMDEDEHQMVDYEGTFEDEYEGLDDEESEEVFKPDTARISVGATCETNMCISPTTTNWYEMTIIDELDSCSTNPFDAGKNTHSEIGLSESAEEMIKLYELLDMDYKI